jgi:flagellar protein FliS
MSSALEKYQDNAVLSASPSRLLTMLYDRLLVDLHAAERALLEQDHAAANYRIRHAGDIVAALASSLRRDLWDGADGLFALYMYVTNALIRASINRDAKLIAECTNLMEPLRQAWHQAADSLAATPAWETNPSADNPEVYAIA